MKVQVRDRIMLQCDCAAEILIVESEKEDRANGGYRLDFNLAIFTHGMYKEKPNLWWRLKYAWRHIWTGKIYTDYMLLEEKKAEALAKFIKENIEMNRTSSI